jgi:hypothetical protein
MNRKRMSPRKGKGRRTGNVKGKRNIDVKKRKGIGKGGRKGREK